MDLQSFGSLQLGEFSRENYMKSEMEYTCGSKSSAKTILAAAHQISRGLYERFTAEENA